MRARVLIIDDDEVVLTSLHNQRRNSWNSINFQVFTKLCSLGKLDLSKGFEAKL